jgi:hypothetical protein
MQIIIIVCLKNSWGYLLLRVNIFDIIINVGNELDYKLSIV